MASTKLVNVGIVDLEKFESRKSPTAMPPMIKDARPHVHQGAIGINELAQSAVSIFLAPISQLELL